MRKIIWATDGSKEAERALGYAKYLAIKSGAEIIGVHVVPLPVQLLYDNLEDSKVHLKNRRLDLESRVVDTFEEVSKSLQKSGVQFEGILLKGKPSDKIREFAKKRNADLIVLGKHGHGFFENMIAGSETIKVLKSSHIPVLAVKNENYKTKVQFKNILVPIDLSECSDSAITYALNLAEVTGASIKVIHILRLDMYAQDLPAGALELVIEQTEKALNKRVTKIKTAFERKKNNSSIKLTNEVIHGMSEAVTISRYAEKNKVDLVVLHTHGRSGISRFLLGSVTERVLSHSKCSVLAIRPD
ncbi:MAG: universal stress protein [Thermodesulfobacteriota bacterium]